MAKKVYTGNEAWEKFGEKLSEIGKLETPMFPFKAGKIQYYNLSGESDIPKYGYYRFEKHDTELIGKTVGFPLTIEKLTAYLAKNCNIQNPQDYSWPLIFAALEQSGEKPEQKKEPVKEPSKEATQAYSLYWGTSYSQEKVAEKMFPKSDPKKTQYKIARMIKQVHEWRKDNGLPVEQAEDKPAFDTIDPAQTDWGQTNGW